MVVLVQQFWDQIALNCLVQARLGGHVGMYCFAILEAAATRWTCDGQLLAGGQGLACCPQQHLLRSTGRLHIAMNDSFYHGPIVCGAMVMAPPNMDVSYHRTEQTRKICVPWSTSVVE